MYTSVAVPLPTEGVFTLPESRLQTEADRDPMGSELECWLVKYLDASALFDSHETQQHVTQIVGDVTAEDRMTLTENVKRDCLQRAVQCIAQRASEVRPEVIPKERRAEMPPAAPVRRAAPLRMASWLEAAGFCSPAQDAGARSHHTPIAES